MMAIIEAILFISGEPVSIKDISKLLDIDIKQAEELMADMSRSFTEQNRGLLVIKVEDAYQLVTRPEYADYIKNLPVSTGNRAYQRPVLKR